MWVECRECEHRTTVEIKTRREMIQVLDAGTVRCTKCGGRMVEG
jgi:ribosomal protein S27E